MGRKKKKQEKRDNAIYLFTHTIRTNYSANLSKALKLIKRHLGTRIIPIYEIVNNFFTSKTGTKTELENGVRNIRAFNIRVADSEIEKYKKTRDQIDEAKKLTNSKTHSDAVIKMIFCYLLDNDFNVQINIKDKETGEVSTVWDFTAAKEKK